MVDGDANRLRTGEDRFAAYLDGIVSVLGHAGRVEPARAYCTGLLLPGARKSVEPMAARIEPGRVQAAHQSMHHVVAKAAWDDAALLAAVREAVLPAIERHGPVAYWIVDDTGFPKQGQHSVGVARQYCGQLGKQDNCQVAVSLSVANDHASLPIAWRLYLPEAWAEDPARRTKAGVPEEVAFATKPEIALEQIRKARADGVPAGVVLGDAGYGDETDFRVGVSEFGLDYVLGIRSGTGVWPPGQAPLPPAPWSGQGRPPTRVRRSAEHQPVSVKKLAQNLPTRAWRRVTWREGSQAELSSRFAAVRIRPAHRDTLRSEPWPEEWLLIEWPKGAAEPSKYWLSNLPPRTPLRRLVHTAKARWLIERDYQELKQEIGLGHYEGRGWRGFHHHASLCIAALGFLVAERCLFPPQQRFTPDWIRAPALPQDFRPRGAAYPA
ncbi:IS701 family transposase [Roseomonas chloroacetimidivorans]|uniref:IS701 family transposase n=1 Tax=Roseomonas chloroacetimidivorans TaxID=1766656 RepID=UPI003C73F839